MLLSERGLGGSEADLEAQAAALARATRASARRRRGDWPGGGGSSSSRAGGSSRAPARRRRVGRLRRPGLPRPARPPPRRHRRRLAQRRRARLPARSRLPAGAPRMAGGGGGRRRGGGRAHPERGGDRPGRGRDVVRRSHRQRRGGALRSGDGRRHRPPCAAAGRDPAFGRGRRARSNRRRSKRPCWRASGRTASLCCRGAKPRERCAAAPPSHAPPIPRLADLDDAALLAGLDDWLPPLLAGKRRLGDIDPAGLTAALDGLLGWPGKQAVERLAPSHFETPGGQPPCDRL